MATLIQADADELRKLFAEFGGANEMFAFYSNIEVTTDVVCGIWKCTAQTVSNRVKAGYITPVNPGNSGKAQHRFLLGEVLKKNPKIPKTN